MRSWLFTICHNAFYTRVKKDQRGPVAVEAFYEADGTEDQPGEPGVAWDLRAFDWEQVDERIVRAVDELSPEHREVLLLWGVEGLKYREIADITGVPIGTVMSRLHRARKTLSQTLESFAGEFGSYGAGRDTDEA
jgi:RNA polymerase sigma-70 factor (ECF subfamily)